MAAGREIRNCGMALKEDNRAGGASGGGKAIADAKVEDAFRTIIKWIGEDPNRDGLIETPDRMVRAYREYFAGYDEDPEEVLRKTFSEVDGYDEMIVLRTILRRSSAEYGSATFRTSGSSASPSSPGWSRSSPSGCRSRSA
jgi:hypothetical protein